MYNTTTLISAIKRNSLTPTSNTRFLDSDFLALANEQIQWLVATEFIAMREDYFIDSSTITLVASQDEYEIPEKANAWVIENIYYVGTDGEETRLPRRTRKSEGYSATSDAPSMVYIEDNKIVVYPDMGTNPTGSIKVYYSRILNLLLEVANCGQVTSVATGATDYVISCDAAPAGLPTANCDIINGKNPYDLFCTNASNTVAGTDVTVAISDCDRIPVVGDWVAKTGFTPVPHIPSEWHPLIVQATVVKLMAASGDAANYQIAVQELGAMLTQLKRVTNRRIKGSPKKIVPRSYVLNRQVNRGWWIG